MPYYIDLKNISLSDYKEKLKNADLLPSRNVLKENIDEYFKMIHIQGIKNLHELQYALKTKKRLLAFMQNSGIPENYLKILIREMNSIHPKPNRLMDFSGISHDLANKLKQKGFTNTLQLYSHILTDKSRRGLAYELETDLNEIEKVAGLTDLSRVRWVNHTFADMLYHVGYKTAKKLAKADYKDVHGSIRKLNEEHKIFKSNIGLHDIKLCVDAANELDYEIDL